MRLKFTPRAAAEFDAVLDQIADHSPRGSIRVKRRFLQIFELLLDHPFAGRTTSVNGLRRIAVMPYPYLVFYRASSSAIEIIAVRHGARNPESMPGHG